MSIISTWSVVSCANTRAESIPLSCRGPSSRSSPGPSYVLSSVQPHQGLPIGIGENSVTRGEQSNLLVIFLSRKRQALFDGRLEKLEVFLGVLQEIFLVHLLPFCQGIIEFASKEKVLPRFKLFAQVGGKANKLRVRACSRSKTIDDFFKSANVRG